MRRRLSYREWITLRRAFHSGYAVDKKWVDDRSLENTHKSSYRMYLKGRKPKWIEDMGF